MSQLAVIVDGRRLPEAEARAIWTRFSAHMDQHEGDFDGFAASEGYRSASVAVAGGTPTLTLATAGSEAAEEHAASTQGAGKGNRAAKRGKPTKGGKKGRKQRRARAQRDDGGGGNEPPRRKR